MSYAVKHLPNNVSLTLTNVDKALEMSLNNHNYIYLIQAQEARVTSEQSKHHLTTYFRIFGGMHLSMIAVETDKHGCTVSTLLDPGEEVRIESIRFSHEEQARVFGMTNKVGFHASPNSSFRFGGDSKVKTDFEVEKAILNHEVSLVPHDVMTALVNQVAQEQTEALLHRQ